MSTMKEFYLTSPIFYVNDKPHIGHAYTSVICDAIARSQRAMGQAVFFATGTDEHGQKVAESARKNGQDTKAFVDSNAQLFAAMAERFNINHDDFIRTTSTRHHRCAQAIWQRIADNGHIYQGHYQGWYARRDEAFYKESELSTTESGQRLAPTGAEVEWIAEPSYFFRLSSFADRLLDHYEAHPAFIRPNERRHEVVSFVKEGLADLSISRTAVTWGIPVPVEGEGANHIIYVWFEALCSYLSAIGYPKHDQRWPVSVHVVGKDILRFHAVYWPAMLLAADLPLPGCVLAHGWWTNAGEKISKSLGNVIDPHQLIDKYGLDQVRYFLLREVRLGNDGDFSDDRLKIRSNVDLADNYGNLCQRVLSLVVRHFQSVVPPCGDLTAEDQQLRQIQDRVITATIEHYQAYQLQQALIRLWELVQEANRYISEQKPWSLPRDRMATVLYNLCSVIRSVTILVAPIMPDAAMSIWMQIGGKEEDISQFSSLHQPLKAGSKLGTLQPVFTKFP